MPQPVDYDNVTTIENDITLNCTQALSYYNCTLWMKMHTIRLYGDSTLNISQCEIREITRRSNIGQPIGCIYAFDNSTIILQHVKWGFDAWDWIGLIVTGNASLWVEDSLLHQQTGSGCGNGIVVNTGGRLFINSSKVFGISTGRGYDAPTIPVFIAGDTRIENTWLGRWELIGIIRGNEQWHNASHWYPAHGTEIPETVACLPVVLAMILPMLNKESRPGP